MTIKLTILIACIIFAGFSELISRTIKRQTFQGNGKRDE
jgi:hypothetical protein